MRMVYVDAVQAHPVPSRAYEARGPFGRYQPREILDTPFDPDKFPVAGATAQNEMRGVPMYECQDCKAVLMETELDGHVCEGDF